MSYYTFVFFMLSLQIRIYFYTYNTIPPRLSTHGLMATGSAAKTRV